MEIYLSIIAALSIIIYLLIIIRHEIHMFQQNSYMYSRYIDWFVRKSNKDTIKKGIFVGILSILSLVISSAMVIYSVLFIYVAILVYLNLKKRKKDKKKLVYTNRVKRLFGIVTVLLLIYISFLIAFKDNMAILLVITFVLISLPQIIVIIANSIISPFELLLNQYYIQDANKMINSHKDLKVIGITGSYGKTSTKNILNQILRTKFNVLMTPESYNTTLGVVRTIREKLKASHEIFIVEMGAKKRYDIKEICNLVKPIFGIITSIGEQHLETFKSVENIVKTKFELFDAIPSYGIAFVNKDDENIMTNIGTEQKKCIFYSMNTSDCEYYLYDVKNSDEGTSFKIKNVDGEELQYTTKLLGRHNLSNILSAISCATECGMTLKEISYAVSDLKPIEHRLELKILSKDQIIIDDAYNSNPLGSKEALNVLSSFYGYKKILITPGMIELGVKQDELNKELGKQAAKCCDHIILVGEKQTKPIYEGINEVGFDMGNCSIAIDLNDAISILNRVKSGRDVVLYENDLPDMYEN